jgi:hypothetical protein
MGGSRPITIATPEAQWPASLQFGDNSDRHPNTNQLKINQPVKCLFASYINAIVKRGQAAASEIIAYWAKMRNSSSKTCISWGVLRMGSSPDSQSNKRSLKAFFRGGFKGVVGGFSARPGQALFLLRIGLQLRVRWSAYLQMLCLGPCYTRKS